MILNIFEMKNFEMGDKFEGLDFLGPLALIRLLHKVKLSLSNAFNGVFEFILRNKDFTSNYWFQMILKIVYSSSIYIMLHW